MTAPIFLVSTGRTGTKFFADFFRSHCSGVRSYHASRNTRLVNVLANMQEAGIVSDALLCATWERLKGPEIRRHQDRYIECNPYYYNVVDAIRSAFRDSRFIFVVRSPTSFVVSHIKWERQRWQSLVANRLVPFWQPATYREQFGGVRNIRLQRVKHYADVWARKNCIMTDSLRGHDFAVTVKFEDVFNSDRGYLVLVALTEWLGLRVVQPIARDTVAAKVNATRSGHGGWWDERCTEIVRATCGPLMEEFGYDR